MTCTCGGDSRRGHWYTCPVATARTLADPVVRGARADLRDRDTDLNTVTINGQPYDIDAVPSSDYALEKGLA